MFDWLVNTSGFGRKAREVALVPWQGVKEIGQLLAEESIHGGSLGIYYYTLNR